MVVIGMIIGRSLTPLNSSRTLRAVRRRETVRRSDDNPRRKMQNVRGDSSAAYFSYGSVSKARHAVELHVYNSVRDFLRRGIKVAGSGCRQFPAQHVIYRSLSGMTK